MHFEYTFDFYMNFNVYYLIFIKSTKI